MSVSSLSILITILLNSISDSLLASLSFIFVTGDISIPFYYGFFLCLTISDVSFCLFLWVQMICFASCLVGVQDSVVQSLWSPCLDVLGLSFLPSVWTLLLYLVFTCWWLPFWWILPSSGFTGIHNSHLVLYAIIQVFLNKVVLQNNKTYASKKNPLPHQQS